MADQDSPFWAYSLRFYADPDTQAACLDAQDRLGADVNVVLYVLFQASRGTRLDPDAVRTADAAAASWRARVVQPLRDLRRDLKTHPHPLPGAAQKAVRDGVKALELRAEQAQQQHLEALNIGGREAPPAEAARNNLAAYAAMLNAAPDDPAFAALEHRFAQLLAAAT